MRYEGGWDGLKERSGRAGREVCRVEGKAGGLELELEVWGQGKVMVRKEDAKNRKTGKRERENEKGMLRG